MAVASKILTVMELSIVANVSVHVLLSLSGFCNGGMCWNDSIRDLGSDLQVFEYFLNWIIIWDYFSQISAELAQVSRNLKRKVGLKSSRLMSLHQFKLGFDLFKFLQISK